MKFLQNWLSINSVPTSLRLLDFAYIVVVIPLFFTIKLPMLVFLFISIILIVKEKKPTNLTLISVGLLGLLSLFFSLYGSFNFAGISRLKLFVELLIYILFIAIVLQRLTGVINIYLKLSPLFLLALSLFYFQSVTMLFYIVIEIFILLLLILWQMMQSNFYRVFRVASLLFLTALPWVIVLFLFFPRISFEHATYGFKGESIKRMGHDGKMFLDNTALLVPSERIVMEVGFTKKIPSSDNLYFRGSVLYNERKNHWEPLFQKNIPHVKQFIDAKNKPIEYKVTLYPTQKRWFYLLDMPHSVSDNADINYDFETKSKNTINKTERYLAHSTLQSYIKESLTETVRKSSLAYNQEHNLKSQILAKEIVSSTSSSKERLLAINKLFEKQELTYTLKPKPLDLVNATDSFLFETKEGYCVHFAAAFTTFARMCNIPSRIVTGYKSDGSRGVENYLVIKEKDAHAWVEVYVDGQWNRVESTALSKHVKMSEKKAKELSAMQKQWETINLNLLYIKYSIETWILEYNYLRQMKLFDNLKSDIGFLVKFILIFLLLIAMGTVMWNALRKEICEDKLLCILRPVLHKLKKLNYVRKEGESLGYFFERIESNSELEHLQSVNHLYHQLRYAPKPTEQMQDDFRKAVKVFLD